jgi:hypothetical protein
VHWDQVNVPQMPYLTMIHTGEKRVRQEDGTPVLTLLYHVLIYTAAGLDPNVIPETQMNNQLDALDQAVKAIGSDIGENRQTLGGLVYKCSPLGPVFVDPGDTDGKGVAAVPFEILLAWYT